MEFNFNVNEIKQDDAFPTIPTGAYKALIKETQIVDVKPKNGELLFRVRKSISILNSLGRLSTGRSKTGLSSKI